jgi:hypothetical protein
MDDAVFTCKACGTSLGRRAALTCVLHRPASLVCLVFFLFTGAVMAFGLAVFPLAPLRQVGDTFVDKLGRPHTAEDFRLFQRWEATLMVTSMCSALTALYASFQQYLRTRSSRPLTGKGTRHPRHAEKAGDAR